MNYLLTFAIETISQIVHWFTPANSSAQQDDSIAKRHYGARSWALDSDKYNRWIDEKKQMLLGPGIPGPCKATELIGLFSTCLDVINKVDSYKDFGFEFRSIIAQFDADKLLFQKWGQNVGIDKDKLKDYHHKDLDNPETALIVEKILSNIQEIFSGTESTLPNLQPMAEAGLRSSLDEAPFPRGRAEHQRFQASTSKRSRIGWTSRGKAKFITQVQQFGALVQRLHTLVPPDLMRRTANVYEGLARDFLGSSNGIFFTMLVSE